MVRPRSALRPVRLERRDELPELCERPLLESFRPLRRGEDSPHEHHALADPPRLTQLREPAEHHAFEHGPVRVELYTHGVAEGDHEVYHVRQELAAVHVRQREPTQEVRFRTPLVLERAEALLEPRPHLPPAAVAVEDAGVDEAVRAPEVGVVQGLEQAVAERDVPPGQGGGVFGVDEKGERAADEGGDLPDLL